VRPEQSLLWLVFLKPAILCIQKVNYFRKAPASGQPGERIAADRAPAHHRAAEELAALFDEWRAEPRDPEEEEGYPEQITPLSLRELRFE
jgi:hypothetical protein